MSRDIAFGLLLASLLLGLGDLFKKMSSIVYMVTDTESSHFSRDGIANIVHSVASRVDDLTEETFIGLVDVGCGHDEYFGWFRGNYLILGGGWKTIAQRT